MKMKKKLTSIFTTLILVLVVLTSCCSMKQFSPPYLVTEQYVKIGTTESSHSLASAYFTVYNNTERIIKKFTLSFRLYDADGEISGIGTNCLVSDYEGMLLPHKEVKVIVKLDNSIGAEVQDAYQIDYTYIKSITYSDGSIWTDPLGLYAW